MTTVNLACSICAEDYGSNDEVLSTNCGHIFHNSCFQIWKSRSESCPECRVESIQTHKVYLHMEDRAERQILPETQNDMAIFISQLEALLEENEIGLKKLKKEHNKVKEEILKLKTKNDCEKAENESLKTEISKLKCQLKEAEKVLSELIEFKSKGGSISRKINWK